MTASSPSPRARQFILLVDRLSLSLARHWLIFVILILAIMACLPVLAPILMYYGFTAPAQLIYLIYSFTCHQLAYRSFFFFGAQPAYTVNQLQAALNTPTPASDVFFWREVHGNADLGYKMAWCERDAAIYFALLAGFVFFGIIRRYAKPLDPRLYLLFVIPMAIDGTWQLVTSPLALVSFLPTHESTALLRVLTGALFGLGTVWLIFPHVDQAMRETYDQAKRQAERLLAQQSYTR
jgi:uncharacterized membrane protein